MKTEFNPSRRDILRTGAALGAWHMGLPLVAGAASDPVYQIGCYTRPWDKYDFRVALDAIDGGCGASKDKNGKAIE